MSMGMPETFKVGTGFKFKGAAGGPTGARLEDRVGVQAPPETIWQLVSNLEGWSAWNPLYVKASGTIRIGEILTLTEQLPGQQARIVQPRVLEWVPNEQLHWRLSRLKGLATATHYIEIEKLNEGACIVSNGVLIGGMFGPSLMRGQARALRKGLHLMNEALKATAETAWREQGGAPTSQA